MSADYQNKVESSTDYSSTFEFDVTWDVDCGPVGTYSTENYGLWQYVVQTVDGTGVSWLQNTICRTGELTWSPFAHTTLALAAVQVSAQSARIGSDILAM